MNATPAPDWVPGCFPGRLGQRHYLSLVGSEQGSMLYQLLLMALFGLWEELALEYSQYPQNTSREMEKKPVTELLRGSLSEAIPLWEFSIMWANIFPSLLGSDWARYSVTCITNIFNIHCAIMTQVFNISPTRLWASWFLRENWLNEWMNGQKEWGKRANCLWTLKACLRPLLLH